MKKKIPIYLIVFLVSLLFYIFIFDEIVDSYSSYFGLYWQLSNRTIYPFVILGYTLFPIFCIWLFDLLIYRHFKFKYWDINFLFICYMIILITLLIKPVYYQSYNLDLDNLKYILNSLSYNTMDLGNILFFIPLAFFFRYYLQSKNFLLRFALFICLGFIIEIFQYVSMFGIFDSIDIVLYIIGYLIGSILSLLLPKKIWELKTKNI